MEVSIALILAAGLVLLGNHLSRIAAERHRKRLSATDVQALQHSLEVLQFVQKHRGLGYVNGLVWGPPMLVLILG